MHKNFEVGEIWYTSWGYEQTNVDFWQVVKSTEKTVWFRPIKKEYTEEGFLRGHSVPVPNKFTTYLFATAKDSIVRKRIPDYSNESIYGNDTWDKFYHYNGKKVHESSYA